MTLQECYEAAGKKFPFRINTPAGRKVVIRRDTGQFYEWFYEDKPTEVCVALKEDPDNKDYTLHKVDEVKVNTEGPEPTCNCSHLSWGAHPAPCAYGVWLSDKRKIEEELFRAKVG